MSRAFIIRPEAEEDLAEARRWYEGRREGLGDEFLEQVDAAFERVRRMPLVPALKYRDARRVLLKRFPYAVFYAVDDEQITVIAVYHTSRDPRGWQSHVPEGEP